VEVLLVVGSWIVEARWKLLDCEFAPGWRGSDELNVMSSQVDLVPTLALVDLVVDGVQMIGGRLNAYDPTQDEPFLTVACVRGDEWDVHTTVPDVLDAVRRVFGGVVDIP